MKITKRQLRRIIKEEKAKLLREQSDNSPPPMESNWFEFAEAMDVGVLDLDSMAHNLGFTDFYDMDMSISPASLSIRDEEAFVDATRGSSSRAEAMEDDQILSAAQRY